MVGDILTWQWQQQLPPPYLLAGAQEDVSTLEELVVTGSRLTKSNVTSSVPLVQIGAEEINSRGVTRIEDVVNILPNVYVDQTAEVANGYAGTSTLNLRGLGQSEPWF